MRKVFIDSFTTLSIMSQLDKSLKFESILGDKNDRTPDKTTLQNAINFRHLSSCSTIGKNSYCLRSRFW